MSNKRKLKPVKLKISKETKKGFSAKTSKHVIEYMDKYAKANGRN